jgi:phosphoribosylaminoimidazole carboxylase (NCAIR synthetase)
MLTMLAIASYFKGDRFLRQAHARGVKVYLLTQAKHLQKAWPREVLADVFGQHDDNPLQHTINTVSYLARTIKFDRIVPLDDYDVETAAALREHLRLPGMGETTARHFRDKLATRVKARDGGLPVPDFVHVLNDAEINAFTDRVPPPWMLKPRSEASAAGITKCHSKEELWKEIEEKGDRRSYYLLEKYLPGDVFHVDSVIWQKKILFAECHRCGKPPFNVAHGGGVFTTATLEHGSADETALRELNERVLARLNMVRGVTHVEYIKSKDDGKFYLLEAASRVGGAHIADVVEASTGLNLWAEWANIEIAGEDGEYALPANLRQEYAGIAISLSRQEKPDTSAYTDPEIVMRTDEKNHVGLIVRSKDPARVRTLVESYADRYLVDFTASMPSKVRPDH